MASPREPPPVAALPTECLLRCFGCLEVRERRDLRLVCKSWAAQLKASGALYEELFVDLTWHHRAGQRRNHVAQQMARWAAARAPYARRLRLTLPPQLMLLRSEQAFCSDLVHSLVAACGTSRRLERLELLNAGELWLPACLQQLSYLRVLDLRAECTFTPLPGWLRSLQALEELHISMEVMDAVALRFLPLELLSCARLRELSLQRCESVTLPLAVGELVSLQRLAVRGCARLAMHEGAFLHNAFASASLRSLTLARCGLAVVPHQIVGMTALRELDLSDNCLAALPATFSVGLKQLEALVLRGNRLARLPRLLARLPRLRALDLSLNPDLQVHESEEGESLEPRPHGGSCWQGGRQQVHTMSSLVGILPQLQELDLRQCPGKRWHPRSLAELERLRCLASPEGSAALGVPCSLRCLLLQ